MRPAACFDFDSLGSGTLTVYSTARRAWEIAGRGEYPPSFPQFMGHQAYTRTPGDFYVATTDDTAGVPDNGMESARMRHQRLQDEWTGAFGQARDELIRGDVGFVRSVMVYSGTKSMLEQLKEMATVCVIGEYDSKMLRYLLHCGGMKVDTVVGDDMGKGTEFQLGRLLNWGFDPSRTVYYGSSRKKLAVAKDLRFHVVEATHEDGPRWNSDKVRRASPNDFPDMFAEMLGIRAGLSEAAYC